MTTHYDYFNMIANFIGKKHVLDIPVNEMEQHWKGLISYYPQGTIAHLKKAYKLELEHYRTSGLINDKTFEKYILIIPIARSIIPAGNPYASLDVPYKYMETKRKAKKVFQLALAGLNAQQISEITHIDRTGNGTYVTLKNGLDFYTPVNRINKDSFETKHAVHYACKAFKLSYVRLRATVFTMLDQKLSKHDLAHWYHIHYNNYNEQKVTPWADIKPVIDKLFKKWR